MDIFTFSFLPEASFVLRVLSSPASVCVLVCLSITCLSAHHNSVAVQARIAKFGPKMQKTLVNVPNVFLVWWGVGWGEGGVWVGVGVGMGVGVWVGGGGRGQLTLTFKVNFNFKLRIYPILSLSAP